MVSTHSRAARRKPVKYTEASDVEQGSSGSDYNPGAEDSAEEMDVNNSDEDFQQTANVRRFGRNSGGKQKPTARRSSTSKKRRIGRGRRGRRRRNKNSNKGKEEKHI
eukprot:comp23393_c0_seq1/m.38774 comp23393_c0_seq1/g.38774  ORF comp23393_c0_seq1/g.38774 comp23393_c0_seq1/m.38774 type:complete len:107 (-) comp23393_c0_seq1:3307-3627(-)